MPTTQDRSDYMRQYAEDNAAHLREYHRVWYEHNKEKRKSQMRAAALRRQYGITVEEYDEMLAAQSGGCAVCHSEVGYGGKRLAVDHDHATGAVRGLLCDRCNTVLGKVNDDPELLSALLDYLSIHNT